MSAPTNEKPVIEFRGCDMLVYAEVLTDGMSGITFGEAKNLAPIGNYGKSSSASSTTRSLVGIPSYFEASAFLILARFSSNGKPS